MTTLSLTLDRGYLAPGGIEGVYRLWLFRGGKPGGEVAVLTVLPCDAGPGLLTRLGRTLGEVAEDHHLEVSGVCWYLRQLAGPGLDQERFWAIEKGALLPVGRADLELLTGEPLPETTPDEYPRGKGGP